MAWDLHLPIFVHHIHADISPRQPILRSPFFICLVPVFWHTISRPLNFPLDRLARLLYTTHQIFNVGIRWQFTENLREMGATGHNEDS